MARIPVVIRCECGRQIEAETGDQVTCECGRRYSAELSAEQQGALHAMRMRMRVFARLGTGVVGLATIVTFVLAGVAAGAVVFVVAFALWYVVLGPIWRRRAATRAATGSASVRRL